MGSTKNSMVLTVVLTCLVTVSAGSEEAQPTGQPIRVAVYSGTGTSDSRRLVLEKLEKLPGFQCKTIDEQGIREGKLSGYDVLIHPGGSGSKQGKALEETGQAKVRDFVEGGGGFIGICAGAYLATSNYSWSLHILDAQVVDREHWARGHGNVKIRLRDEGKRILDCKRDLETIYYYQGPLLAPGGEADVPDYQALATFETEIARNGAPQGVMKGTTAIADGAYGAGRVICFSPHPERTEGLESFLQSAVRWVAAGQAAPPVSSGGASQ
ncbi:MAG: BPL-N domain-containing protein [Thermoguttaceae bacterium]